MPRYGSRSATPILRTAPVLAVLVCHDGAQWLPEALAALRRSVPRPRHVLAVDTGSVDETPRLLAEAAKGEDRILDGVRTLARDTGFAAAVHDAVSAAIERWGDPGGWIWVLHDDCAPDQNCLSTLLTAAEVSPSAGVLGPLALDWHDPRLVVEAGLSTDASGHRQTGVGPAELARHFEQSTEVLAVPSAGMLVRRDLWERLGGFDPFIHALREDIDFGWRANRSGAVVLCVPAATMRHVRAVTTELRGLDTHPVALGVSPRAIDRGYGLRTFLVNCSLLSFVLGVPRLTVLTLLRALGFGLQRRLVECRAELLALGYLLGGRARLREGRAQRKAFGQTGTTRGLFTSRFTRLRNATRGTLAQLVRRRIEADAALGRLTSEPGAEAVWLPPETPAPRRIGPDALPAGVGRPRSAGLRRPGTAVAVPLSIPDTELPAELRPSPRPRPSPGAPAAEPDLLLVEVSRGRLAREVLLAPPLLLFLGLLALGLVVNAGRLGLDLAGGRLFPVGDLGTVWSEYLATWHPVAGGTAAPAPTALAVIGGLGALLLPFGGSQTAIAVLLLGDLPIAGLVAYAATRRMPVRRWIRALVAAAYAMLPAATASVAQGRLAVVVVHLLLPAVVAGIVALFVRFRAVTGSTAWLSTAAGTAFGLAVLGAFAPLVHLLLVLYALAGFVVVPGGRGHGRRRVAALFVLVLMPLALLLPWPAVVIQHPGVVLHGIGAWVREPAVTLLELVSLDPGGPGAWPVVGLVVALAVVVAFAIRPHRAMLPGLSLMLLGILAVAAVRRYPVEPVNGAPAQLGFAGGPLLVVGWGMLWALLGACRLMPGRTHARCARIAAGLGLAGLAALATGAVVAGRQGPLGDDGGSRLASTVRHELTDTGRSVLIVPSDPGEPVRQVAGRSVRFGDDDLAPVPGADGRLRGWRDGLLSGDAERTRATIGSAATAGVAFVVLPDGAAASRVAAAAGDLVSAGPSTSDGRPVLRVQLAGGQVTLLSPELGKQAIGGGAPLATLGTAGIVPVDAEPPAVAVRTSDGPDGRLLVIAGNEEPGWLATVDGRQVPVVRAWGHLVGVQVPTRAAEIRVEQPTALRGVLLLIEAAVVLFTLLTALPGRRRPS